MTTTTTAHRTEPDTPTFSVHKRWLALWAFVTAFAVFEVVKHGYVNGSASYAAVLTTTAVGAFIAPDLTFVVGIRDDVPHGSMSRKAVPFYNAAHRMTVALGLTLVIGIGLAPLNSAAVVAFVGGLSWMAHIAMDRAAGYGLRNADGSR